MTDKLWGMHRIMAEKIIIKMLIKKMILPLAGTIVIIQKIY